METGNEDGVYAAVGRAIVKWYSVEVELCRVFCQASYPDRFHPLFSDSPLAQAFWAMRSADMRLNATSKMIDSSEYGALFGDEWKAIDRKVRVCSRKRNRIAHGSLVFHNEVGENGEMEVQYRFIPFFLPRVPRHSSGLTFSKLNGFPQVRYNERSRSFASSPWKSTAS